MKDSAVHEKGIDDLTVAERLTNLWSARLGPKSTYGDFAKKCGVPESTAKGWLNGESLPGGVALRAIRRAFDIPVDYVLMGASPKGPADRTVHSALRKLAPEVIPSTWKEEVGVLVQMVGHQVGAENPGEARKATLSVLTAPMAEIRRLRGERTVNSTRLLEELSVYRGPAALKMYLLWARLAVELAMPGYQAPKAKAPKAKVKKRSAQR